MPSFKDKDGREWMLSLDGPKIREVRKIFDGLDLADPEGKAFEQLEADPCLLVDVLWVLCRSQANGVTDEQFGSALVGDAIDSAIAAMLESIADFFPATKRKLLRAITAKNAKLRELGVNRALEKLNDPKLEAQIVEKLEANMDAQIQTALTQLSLATDSPDSSE